MAPPSHVPQHCLERVATHGKPGLVVRVCDLLLVWLRGAWVPRGEGCLVGVRPARPGWCALYALLLDRCQLQDDVCILAFFVCVRPVLPPGLDRCFFFSLELRPLAYVTIVP